MNYLKCIKLFSAIDGECTCKGDRCSHPGNHPAVSKWNENFTSNELEINKWLQTGKYNVGILTGRENNIEVLDIDPKNGGIDSLKFLLNKYKIINTNYVVKTGSGGLHLYCLYAGEFKNREIIPGIDWKTDGGYVCAPPSTHVSGNKYYQIENFSFNKYLSGEYDD